MSSLKRNPNCNLCPLHKTAEHVCLLGHGSGKLGMIIGEAPGHREDDSGVPFVGKSGKLLDKLMDDVGLKRRDFYITNAVHCRPPDNRTPTKKEIATCKQWLDKEIAYYEPKYVLLLGNVPLLSVLGIKGIKKARGKPIEKDGVFYLPTYHPSYALRDPRQETVLRNDFRSFQQLIEFGGLPKEESLDIRVVENHSDLAEMLRDIRSAAVGSFDTETSGLYPFAKGAHITSFGIGTRDKQWVLPLQHREGFLYNNHLAQKLAVKAVIEAAQDMRIVAHNGKFDALFVKVIYDLNIRIDDDTMLMHYILDENNRHGLKELAATFLNAPDYDIDADDKKGLAPLPKLSIYHAHDLFYTRKLYFLFLKELKTDSQLYRVYRKLIMPTANMFIGIQHHGVYVDQKKLKEVQVILHQRVDTAKAEMDKIAPGILWSSPKQVGDLFYKKLKLPVLRKTDKGAPSTAEDVLKQLAEMHPIPNQLMKFREAQQLLSFYVEGWQDWIIDSYIHPNFLIHGTVTGRLSASEPGLQQVPRDPLIRSILCAPPGWEFVEADLSQIELRIAAELANEETMLASFQTGEDVHWKTVMRELMNSGGMAEKVLATGRELTGEKLGHGDCILAMIKAGPDVCIEIDKGWKELRKKAKAINFGYLYGMWWKKFIIYARDNYGVKVSEKEAEASRKNFFILYPEFEPWHNAQKKKARRYGYVRTLTGRKRRLPDAQKVTSGYDFAKSEAERQAINSPVQSFASDLNLMAALEMTDEFDLKRFQILGTVHDAILMLIKKDYLRHCVPRIKSIMSHPKLMDDFEIELSVPIEAEVTIGPWGAGVDEAKYFKEKANG